MVRASFGIFTTENALTADIIGTVGGNNLGHDYQIEYNEVWNASVEHEWNASTLLSVSYVGSRSVHADSGTGLNLALARSRSDRGAPGHSGTEPDQRHSLERMGQLQRAFVEYQTAFDQGAAV